MHGQRVGRAFCKKEDVARFDVQRIFAEIVGCRALQNVCKGVVLSAVWILIEGSHAYGCADCSAKIQYGRPTVQQSQFFHRAFPLSGYIIAKNIKISIKKRFLCPIFLKVYKNYIYKYMEDYVQ